MAETEPVLTHSGPSERTLDLSDCPWFRGTGKCNHHCTTEPSCETDRPAGGWPGESFNTCPGDHTFGKCDRDNCNFERLYG